MALINFDCPECGHNLEVDERGAGFIIKCPECDTPFQVPDLPKSHRLRKLAMASAAVLLVLFLLAANAYFWQHITRLQHENAEKQAAFDQLRQEAQVLAMEQEAEIERLKADVAQRQQASQNQLTEAALAAMEEAESLAQELEHVSLLFLNNHEGRRMDLLRQHMAQVVESAKNGLPAPPTITELGPGKGLQGRLVVFPILPGPEGQILRENAEVTSVEEDKISVRFAGGSATYFLSELHPGVAAFLPVNRLYVLPRRQWAGEVLRVHQLENARREERIAGLRDAIELQLPNE